MFRRGSITIERWGWQQHKALTFSRETRERSRAGQTLIDAERKKTFSSSRVDKMKSAESSSKEFSHFVNEKKFEIETIHERDCNAKRGVSRALRGENVKHLNIMWTREFRTKPAITILLWFMLSLFGYYRTRNAPYGMEKLLSLVLRACRLKLTEG